MRRPDTESAEWYTVPTYAEIFGVPFNYMLDATKDGNGPNAPGLNVIAIAKVDLNLAVKFPLVETYRWLRTSEVDVLLNASKVRSFELVEEELAGEAGELKQIRMQTCPDMDSVAWFLAAETVKKLTKGTNIDRGDLFCKMVPAVVDWINKAIKRNNYDPRWLCALPNRVRIVDSIILACDIVHSDGSGNVEPRPAVAMVDTTASKTYVTTVPSSDYVYDCPARCSHTAAPCHSKLEARVARILDRMPIVKAWMRNHPKIGWTIPYYHGDRWKHYQPDFVARLDARGVVVNCIVEVKGVEDDESMSKAHFAKNVWVKAVNAERKYGRWAFLQVSNESEVRPELEGIVRGVVSR